MILKKEMELELKHNADDCTMTLTVTREFAEMIIDIMRDNGIGVVVNEPREGILTLKITLLSNG